MNCLRCGRTVPDQVLFCPECAQKAPPRRSLRRVDTDFDPNQEESSAEVQGLRHRISRLHRWAAAEVGKRRLTVARYSSTRGGPSRTTVYDH